MTANDIGDIGGPYRTIGVPAQATQDPLRQWYVDNAGWNYTEFNWDEELQAPKNVAWEQGTTRFTLEVKTRTNTGQWDARAKKNITTRMIDQLSITAADPRITKFLANHLRPTKVTTKSGDHWFFQDGPDGDPVTVLTMEPQAVSIQLAQRIEAGIEAFLRTNMT